MTSMELPNLAVETSLISAMKDASSALRCFEV